jgi:Rhs element Vgr protein
MPLETARSAALTTFTIKVNGTVIPDTYGVLSIEIGHEVGYIPYAHIVLQDGDTAARTFAVSESDTFVPGGQIEIDLGYDRDEKTVFKGVVTRQRIDAPSHGSSRLHVEAMHPCFRMAHARKSRAWADTTDADAISDLAAAHGIGFDGSSDAPRPQLYQHQASDWDFAVLRTERIGQLLTAELGGLRMFKPDPAATPDVTLEYGINLFSFNLELDASRQPESVEVGAWTPADREVTTGEASPDDVAGPGNLLGGHLASVATLKLRPRHPGLRDQAELDEWAASEMLRRRLAAITGSVEAQGSAEFLPGQTVELKGMGARFNGRAFVSGLRHTIIRGDWHTLLQIGLNPLFHNERHEVSAPPAAGFAPGISGLQIGTVSQLEGDPAGEDRVAVLLATETETVEPIWARTLSIGGGDQRGLVMLPEVGDECLVGFLDDDPRDPVLIGGLHSSAAPSPLPGADDNHRKGITSRGGMQILFDDEGISLTLKTPNGNTAILSDDEGAVTLEDENGNKITANSGGITLEASKDLILKAAGDIKIEGVNVKIDAQAQAEMSGSGGAKLESAGQSVVKGSIVMIN